MHPQADEPLQGWRRVIENKQIAYIKAVLTHQDYDKGAWKS